MSRSSTRRQGTTLVEVLLFGALGTLVLVSAWGLLATGLRRGAHTETKVRGVEAALFASRRLEADLRALAGRGEVAGLHLEGDADGFVLRFRRYDAAGTGPSWGPLPTLEVEWRWEAATHRLLRRQGEEDPEVLPGAYVDLRARLLTGTPDRAPAPGEGPLIEYRLVATSAEWLGLAEDRRSSTGRVELRGAVALSNRIRQYHYPHHSRVPDGTQA